MAEAREEKSEKYAKLIAKAWSDGSFKKRLIADPKTVLLAEGISVPPGLDPRYVGSLLL